MAKKKNKPHLGLGVKGRPFYSDPNVMQIEIDKYFNEVCQPAYARDDNGNIFKDNHGIPIVVEHNPPTVSGLAIHLGFEDRRSLCTYKGNDVFAPVIKKAISRIEANVEKMLMLKERPAGVIFWLKAHGWKEDNNETSENGDGILPDLIKESMRMQKDG